MLDTKQNNIPFTPENFEKVKRMIERDNNPTRRNVNTYKERLRAKYGLERKTKLNIPFHPMTRAQTCQKHVMIKKYNYFADPDDRHAVCYDSQTRRSERSERTAIRHGLRIVEGGEEQ